MGSLRGGHYTCYARGAGGAGGGDGGFWHLNDSSVTPIAAGRVVTPAAYILVYTRRDIARAPPNALRRAFPRGRTSLGS